MRRDALGIVPPATPLAASSSQDVGRIEPLSGLRFFAVAYVVVRHLGEASVASLPMVFERIRRHAYHVMPLFFVLSGFLLTYVYGEPIRSGRFGARAFWLSRLLRIWPIYLVALALRIVVDAHANHGITYLNAVGALSQAFLVQCWTPPFVWYGNAQGWTVSVEVFLYLIFPWLVVHAMQMSTRRALLLAGASWVIGQLVALAYAIELPDGWPVPDDPDALYLDLLRYLPPLHFPSFLVGVAAGLLHARDLATGRLRSGVLLALAGGLPIAFVLTGGIEMTARWAGVTDVRNALVFPLGHNGLLTPAWALLVLGLSQGETWSRWLGARPLVRLGESSYALYILHFAAYDAVAGFLIPNWKESRLFLVQLFLLLLPLSVLSFERFERPFRVALLKRWNAR